MVSPNNIVRWTDVSHVVAATFVGVNIDHHVSAQKAVIMDTVELYELQRTGDLALFRIPRDIGWLVILTDLSSKLHYVLGK